MVSHILASASENGKIVVWDLKINKAIFNFTEPSQTSSGAGGADDYFDYYGGSGMDQQHSQKKQNQQVNSKPISNLQIDTKGNRDGVEPRDSYLVLSG